MPANDTMQMIMDHRHTNDWTGSSSQRRRQPPTTERNQPEHRPLPTPKPKNYLIQPGTPALCKKVGENWIHITTSKLASFDKPYRKTDKALIFFSNGWLLCVRKDRVSIEPR